MYFNVRLDVPVWRYQLGIPCNCSFSVLISGTFQSKRKMLRGDESPAELRFAFLCLFFIIQDYINNYCGLNGLDKPLGCIFCDVIRIEYACV